MIDTFVSKVKGMILDPIATFKASAADELGQVLVYFAILLLINAALSALILALGIEFVKPMAGMSFGLAMPVFIFIALLVGGFIMTLIAAAWLHLWVYVLGGRKGICQTLYAVIYASTPRLILGWIPFIGVLFALWTLVLGILGIRELQDLSTGRAVAAMAIAVLIPLIIIILVAAYFFSTLVAMGPVPVAPLNS